MADDLFSEPQEDVSLREQIIAKWKDKPQEELLNAKAESDLYIKTLERRSDEFRDRIAKLENETNATARLQEYLDRVEKQVPPAHASNENTPPVNDVKPLAVDDVRKIVEDLENSKTQTSNFKTVQNKLIEKYGNSYASILQDQIDNLGLTKEYFNDLAKKFPAVAIRTLGLDEPAVKDPFQAPPRGSTNTSNFAPKGPTKRTWSYYQNLKSTNPKLYSDPKTTVQMHKDYEALGSEFEDGDFNAV